MTTPVAFAQQPAPAPARAPAPTPEPTPAPAPPPPPPPVSAPLPVAGSAEYDRLIDEALSEFDAGNFEEALSAFEQAYKIKASARALRGIAKALFERRSYARAIEAIDRALRSDVDPLNGSLRADLDALKTRALHFVGEAILEITPSNATVLFDGAPADATKQSSRLVDVGTHTLEVSAPGYESQQRKLEIHGGERTSIAVRLNPVRAATIPAAAPNTESSRALPLVLAIGAVVASTGAVVGSSIWFVERGDAVDRCEAAAAAGAECANAESIAFQRNMSMWTVGLSSVALVASAVALVFVLRGDKKAATRTSRVFRAPAVLSW